MNNYPVRFQAIVTYTNHGQATTKHESGYMAANGAVQFGLLDLSKDTIDANADITLGTVTPAQ